VVPQEPSHVREMRTVLQEIGWADFLSDPDRDFSPRRSEFPLLRQTRKVRGFHSVVERVAGTRGWIGLHSVW
jgi:hypothetical protein